MRVFVTGGTGFVGSALCRALVERGDQPVVVSRDAARAAQSLPAEVEIVEGDPTLGGDWQGSVAGVDAVVNLAGQSVAGAKWTAQRKQIIHDSRVECTRYLVEAIAAAPSDARPTVLVSASGVDYYPFSDDLGAAVGDWDDDDEIDERAPPSDSFLGRVCRNWEAEARVAAAHGVRVAILRFGVILGGDGGPLEKMTTPFKLFAGGRIGSGKQWMSWVHLADVIGAILFALDDPRVKGPANVVAPEPVRNRAFARALGKALSRPSWLPVPAFALRAAVGEFSDHLLHGRRAVPRALTDWGYRFRFPDVDAALADIY